MFADSENVHEFKKMEKNSWFKTMYTNSKKFHDLKNIHDFKENVREFKICLWLKRMFTSLKIFNISNFLMNFQNVSGSKKFKNFSKNIFMIKNVREFIKCSSFQKIFTILEHIHQFKIYCKIEKIKNENLILHLLEN